jgi:hypothetical protein
MSSSLLYYPRGTAENPDRRGEVNIVDVGVSVAITRVADVLPCAADVERAQRRLDLIGWPTDSDS